ARRIEGVAARLTEIERKVDVESLRQSKEKWIAFRGAPEHWKDVEVVEHAQEELERVELALTRIERLSASVAGFRDAGLRAQGRAALSKLAWRLSEFEVVLLDAERELCTLGWEGSHDAIVQVAPVGASGRDARDRLAGVYRAWAEHRAFFVDCLHEPRSD